MSLQLVGDVRPSQLLWSYGPGALIDLPNMTAITMGLDKWDIDRCPLVEEVRLLTAVRKILGPQVESLRIPPFVNDEDASPFSAESKVGVPVRPFPRWLRCVKCGLLSEYDSGLFNIKVNPYRPEHSHFVHTNCEKGGNAGAVPARFILACRNGHLDDFPWHWFVHKGSSKCKGTLRFFESSASLQTSNLWVKCDQCDTPARSMVDAFGSKAKENLPACRGRHPHLDKYDPECNELARAVNLGAVNNWFPITLSVLAIPKEKNLLSDLIFNGWEHFKEADSIDYVKIVVKTLLTTNTLPGIDKFSPEEIWLSIQDRKKNNTTEIVSDEDIKSPEWEVFISSDTPKDWPNFSTRKVEKPSAYKRYLHSVLLLERLREVNALIGFTRVEEPEVSAEEDERPPMANLSKDIPNWIPAGEVHGEGIFIRFNEKKVSDWENLDGVRFRNEMLQRGHVGWRNARKLDPKIGYPGIRYAMLHTFSHLLISELALECGYNEASIRERIYADTRNSPMAGVLIYTAAADSDGTLGGLVDLGKPENFGRLIQQALNRAMVCASDPLCSEHNPGEDRSLHAASCHACTFVPETSCERGNRYLDRTLLVETVDCKDSAFFRN